MKDKVSSGIAGLSFIVSCLALYISYDTQQMSKESLSISIQKDHLTNLEFMKQPGMLISSVRTGWIIDVTNLSTLNNSVVRLNASDIGESGGKRYWEGFVRAMLDDRSKEKLLFPFLIEPGNTKRLYLEVGTEVPKKMIPLIENYMSTCDPKTLRGLQLYLARQGTDIFGNDVEYIGENINDLCSDVGVMSINLNQRNWSLIVEVETARGSTFLGRANWY